MKHVAIIMDGNGRWAASRGVPRIDGHTTGRDVAIDILEYAGELGLEQLTLYAFSQENWKRSKEEVDGLMELLKASMIGERDRIMEANLRFCVIGRISELREDVRKEIEENVRISASNTGIRACVALNYGGRGEIVDAVRSIVRKSLECGVFFDQIDKLIDEDYISDHLYTAGMPDPDLIIRTAGEKRISNFLLWQSSYAEFWSTETYWPDFTRKNFDEALEAYANRERRFGGRNDE